MLARNGMAAAIEQVLTLPIRGAPYTIEPAKGDKGEAEFVQSVLMTPNESGGMKTPISELLGQITAAQVFKRSFFEKTFKTRESDGKIIYDAVAFRPPATCQARYNDRSGKPNGFRQQVWLFGGNLMLNNKQKVPGYVDIPKIRSYIYTAGKHREPLTGVSEMETSFWPLKHGSEVQTPRGPVLIEDIRRGDMIFGANGGIVPVLDVLPGGEQQMYRFTFKNGEAVEAGPDHLWGVYDTTPGGRKVYRVMSTREIMNAGLKRSSGWRFGVPRCQAVAYAECDFPLDPYVLGAWLGDGSFIRKGVTFGSFEADDFIADEIRSRLPASMNLKAAKAHGYYAFQPVVPRGRNAVVAALNDLGIRTLHSPDRFIPEIYLRGSVKQRWDLLRGLMDTDGFAPHSRGRVAGRGVPSVLARYCTTSRRLAEDVRTLVRSLGGNAVISENAAIGTSVIKATGKVITGHYRGLVVAIDVDECPFLLPRKESCWLEGRASLARRKFPENKIVAIEMTTVEPCQCITVGPERPEGPEGGDAEKMSASPDVPGDGLFLTNDYIVTHNCYQTMSKLLYLLERSG
jgi:hypothetical protein